MKTDNFVLQSKKISNDFIQNVIFIDDEAFKKADNSGANDLDPTALTHAFARHRKICAVYNPQAEAEISDLAFVAKKADIAVLDWRINLKDVNIQPENEEDDEDNIDPRGQHTIKILKEVLSVGDIGHDGLKLVLIYTGEIDLAAITTEIFNELNNPKYKKDTDFKISSDYTSILVIGKPALEKQFKHNPELLKQIVSYELLPDFITQEFSKMTSGLVSNMALNAISTIRKSTARILKIYNKQIDPAFLAHRSLLPTPEDAGDLLKDSIISSFSSILDYHNVIDNCSFKQIKDWIGQFTFSAKEIKLQKQQVKISEAELKNWQLKGYLNFLKEAMQKQFPAVVITDEAILKLFRSTKDTLPFFTPDDYISLNSNEKFSILTHHKSNYTDSSYRPKLTLGTVLKGTKNNQYWICIQQKCDSVRIQANESRKFLFLPLDVITDDKSFHFLEQTEGSFVKLKVDYNTHKIRTIRFQANLNEMVYARKYGKNPNYLFKPLYSKGHKKFDAKSDEMFQWAFDLKDAHAQKVANHYAAQLSRVGLDESEWLRRNSN
ncbi:response regulator receiver domain [Mucilaginibacter sp. McL0603]|uniref:response regulator receiver domain n=1 Tax=Mucilaginibacter sp. McL0603 TaxID=3415670 RepID=UPI003CE9E7F3